MGKITVRRRITRLTVGEPPIVREDVPAAEEPLEIRVRTLSTYAVAGDPLIGGPELLVTFPDLLRAEQAVNSMVIYPGTERVAVPSAKPESTVAV